jgi:Sulfotransferase family
VSTSADSATPLHAIAGAGRVPDFFIVGHEKCGTTALDLMLKEHPQIFLPEIKEQRFFAPELRGAKPGRQNLDAARPHTFDRYVQVFAAAGERQLVGECSPQYLRSHGAAGRIAEVRPDAKIVAILREPASFLRSYHLQWVQNNVESEQDFRKALALEADRRQGRRIPCRCKVPQNLFYSDHVRYVEQLRRYSELFAPEQILVLIYDDFRRDNVATVRRVLRFLDVDDTIEIDTIETKQLKAVRSFRLKHLAEAARTARHNPAASDRLGRVVNALTPAPLRSDAFRAKWRSVVYKTPAPPDERLMAELRERFKPEVVALSELLGRDLVAEWGYEDVR